MSMETANVILQQIKSGSDAAGLNSGGKCMMCWGTHDIKAVSQEKKHRGGLIFNVQGFFHLGKVVITLKFSDTYDMSFLNSDDTSKHTIEGVYCDQLTEIIDSYVETNSFHHH